MIYNFEIFFTSTCLRTGDKLHLWLNLYSWGKDLSKMRSSDYACLSNSLSNPTMQTNINQGNQGVNPSQKLGRRLQIRKLVVLGGNLISRRSDYCSLFRRDQPFQKIERLFELGWQRSRGATTVGPNNINAVTFNCKTDSNANQGRVLQTIEVVYHSQRRCFYVWPLVPTNGFLRRFWGTYEVVHVVMSRFSLRTGTSKKTWKMTN